MREWATCCDFDASGCASSIAICCWFTPARLATPASTTGGDSAPQVRQGDAGGISPRAARPEGQLQRRARDRGLRTPVRPSPFAEPMGLRRACGASPERHGPPGVRNDGKITVSLRSNVADRKEAGRRAAEALQRVVPLSEAARPGAVHELQIAATALPCPARQAVRSTRSRLQRPRLMNGQWRAALNLHSPTISPESTGVCPAVRRSQSPTSTTTWSAHQIDRARDR